MNKHHVRSQLRQRRKLLSTEQLADNSAAVIKHLIRSDLYQQAQHIAIYLPANGEVDLTEMLKVANKTFYLPSINQQQMQFQPYTDQLKLSAHRFGIKQPQFIDQLKAAPLDLCLMPLVGFDIHGNRLGMGGGFYDRYFAHNTDTVLAGIAHQFQQVSQLPTESWDVKINHIFTEQGHQKL